MKATIFSVDPVSAKEAGRVRDILRESKCPNESLKETFPERYHGMKVVDSFGLLLIYFDGGSRDVGQKLEIEY